MMIVINGKYTNFELLYSKDRMLVPPRGKDEIEEIILYIHKEWSFAKSPFVYNHLLIVH